MRNDPATLPPRARARFNAAAHELRPTDAALAGGPAEFLLERKVEGVKLAALRWRDKSSLDLHLTREHLLPEAAAALPSLLAHLAPRLDLDKVLQLRLYSGGAALGGKPRKLDERNVGRAGMVKTVQAVLARAMGKRPAARRIDPELGTAERLAIPRDYGQVRGLERCREPRVLACVGLDAFGRNQWLAPRAATAWLRMRDAAARDGIALQLVSAFRSVAYQSGLFRRKLARGLAIDEILQVNAAPGYSEHHTGRAVDVGAPGYAPAEEEFERSPAFAWLKRHAASHGFRLSYPRGNPHGITYEPWHWYYVR